jgi:hypothetical protein
MRLRPQAFLLTARRVRLADDFLPDVCISDGDAFTYLYAKACHSSTIIRIKKKGWMCISAGQGL